MDSVFTIGHSNQQIAAFIALLKQHRIEVLIDVRSFPVSKYSTQFNRTALKPVLSEHGIKYSFLGNELGGRPRGPEFYDEQGYVLYNLVALMPAFERGIERLMSNVGRPRCSRLTVRNRRRFSSGRLGEHVMTGPRRGDR